MKTSLRALALCGALLALPAFPASALDIRLDFDDDNDPATLRTALPTGQLAATARFVLVVDALPLPAEPQLLLVQEGCCEAPPWFGHHGTWVEMDSLQFDAAYVADAFPLFPTCTYCCPWVLELTLAAGAPVVPGGSYFIGQGVWHAECAVEAACTPPTSFSLTGDGIEGSGPMVFNCPGVPSATDAWGDVKAIWR